MNQKWLVLLLFVFDSGLFASQKGNQTTLERFREYQNQHLPSIPERGRLQHPVYNDLDAIIEGLKNLPENLASRSENLASSKLDESLIKKVVLAVYEHENALYNQKIEDLRTELVILRLKNNQKIKKQASGLLTFIAKTQNQKNFINTYCARLLAVPSRRSLSRITYLQSRQQENLSSNIDNIPVRKPTIFSQEEK